MVRRQVLLATAAVTIAISAGLLLTVRQAGAGTDAQQPAAAPAGSGAQIPADQRRAYFGDLHLHTTMSLDAWTFGSRVTPDQAYRFARGETVMVPATQMSAEHGIATTQPMPARRAWPLDFMAVTDHSEYLGGFTQLELPGSAFSLSAIGQKFKEAGRAGFIVLTMMRGEAETAKALAAASEASDGWNLEMRAANANYQPGKFTTFIGYEWSASPGQGIHMHRNVIFSGDTAPTPFSANDSNRPEDLWKYLETARARGSDVLAIPHNSNFSDGRDFDWNNSDGQPIDAAYARARAVNEPLVEIAQTKGTSETTPELSPNDEFAGFEVMDRLYKGQTSPNQHGSYVREALGRGLTIQNRIGANPFKMGLVGASDAHNGLSASDENAFASGEATLDPRTMLPTGANAKRALGMGPPPTLRPNGQRENDPIQFGSAALTGVWAEENTRGSIFAALKRKETFATSGTRIRVRMFGGWTFSDAMLKQSGWVARAYAAGVPMGRDLPQRPAQAKAPTFILQASKDPTGANLDRIQVVKLWVENGVQKEKVFNVALSGNRKAGADGRAPPVGNTVDLKTGRASNTIGSGMLTVAWRDPEFDPKSPAVYYGRVLEVPSPRWSTLLAIHNGLPLPAKAPPTIQERAWTSPIWFTPGA
ncbi:MAG: hypothetical protein CFE28_12960 [Alphaproteobacteria bacterium PA2]|nr:MAG: hypothetical protein CFE28_12960 [Alphaproteobacteria bacterium PA2]